MPCATGSQAVAHREEGDVEEEASPVSVERADLQERGVERPQQPPLKKKAAGGSPVNFGGVALWLAISGRWGRNTKCGNRGAQNFVVTGC